MSTLRNSVLLIGNIGQDPDVKELTGGKKVAKFSIATSETYTNEKGEKTTETQWHTVVAWGKQAEFIEKHVKKGNEVAIEGKLINRSYTDKDSIKRYVTEIVCNEILMLGKKAKVQEESPEGT